MTTFVLSFYSILLLWVLPTHLIAFHRSNHTSPSWRSNSVLVLDFLVFCCMAQGTKWIGKGLFAIPLIVRVWCKCYFALKNFLTFHTFPSHSLLYTAPGPFYTVLLVSKSSYLQNQGFSPSLDWNLWLAWSQPPNYLL